MYQTLSSAITDVNLTEDPIEKLKTLKKILEATALALINSAVGDLVEEYSVNTGQSVIKIKKTAYDTLFKTYIRMNALFKEIYGIESGTNMMALRDAQSNKQGFDSLL